MTRASDMKVKSRCMLRQVSVDERSPAVTPKHALTKDETGLKFLLLHISETTNS